MPNAPNNFFVTTIAPQHTIQINWDDQADNELGFEFYRSVLPGGPYTLITTPTTPATISANNPQGFTSEGLTPNTTYYYRMRSVNNKGGSAYTP
ncbi:MAG: fibronectin type III domain-containing protein [Cyclobacteriaceae bacterium]|nr:fibronectin type III domain-containing protein [Cyclobacteriaceae bacterium]